MNKYTIYCTPEQTKKALELGAPIEYSMYNPKRPYYDIALISKDGVARCSSFSSPTAEQMIGWLEEQGLCIEPYRTACGYLCTISKVPTGSQIYSQEYEGDDVDSGQFITRGKATLAAIDAALEYLSKKSKYEIFDSIL